MKKNNFKFKPMKESKVSKRVIYISSALLAATTFAAFNSLNPGNNSLSGTNQVQAATSLQIARLDGLVTNTNSISFYIPNAQTHSISAIGVKSPKTGGWLWWSGKNIQQSSDKQHFTVQFTNPDNIAFINNEANVGKSMTFQIQFDNKTLIIDNYQKTIDSSELMNAKKQGKLTIDSLVNLTATQAEDYKTQIENSTTSQQITDIITQAKAADNLVNLNNYRKQKQTELKQTADNIIEWILSWFRKNPLSLLNPKELARQTALINQVKSSLNQAQTDLNNANSITDIDRIVNNAKLNFNQTKESTDTNTADALKKSAQANAKKELQVKYNSLNSQLNMMSDLDDKSSLQIELTNAFNSGNTSIDNASSADDVNSKKTSAMTNLDNVLVKAQNQQKTNQNNRLTNDKTPVQTSLSNQYQQLLNKFNNLPNSTPEDKKSDLKNQLDIFNSQDNKDKINNAVDSDSLKQTEKDLSQQFQTLNNNLDVAQLQEEVKELISSKAIDAQNTVSGMGSIGDKTQILSNISETANGLINQLPNNMSDLAVYKDKIIHTFDKVKADAGVKDQTNLSDSKKEFSKSIADKKTEIQAIVDQLNEPQKTQLTSELASKSKAGTDNVNNATDSTKAQLAKDESLVNLESLKQKVLKTKSSQEEANNNQEQASNAKSYIQNLQPLSDDKKQTFNNQINDLVNKYQVELSKESADINVLSNGFSKEIETIKSTADLANQKQILDSQITQKNADAQKVIDNSYNLSSEQRTKFTKDLAKQTSDLRQLISGAQNVTDLDGKKTNINQLDDFAKNTKLADDKAKAAHDLKVKAQEVKNGIKKLPGLNQNQIEIANQSIDNQLKNGLQELEKTEVTDVLSKKDAISSGLDAVLSQNTQSSNQALNDKRGQLASDLENKRSSLESEIQKLPNLDLTRVNTVVDQIAAMKNKAVNELASVGSFDQMEQVKNSAVANMDDAFNQLKLESDKAKAKDTLSKNINSTKGRIDSLAGLDDNDKKSAQQELENIENQIPDVFNNLTSDNAIAQKQLDLQKQINQVYDKYNQKSNENINAAKTNAKSRLTALRNDLLDKLDGDADFNALTLDEKESYKSQIKSSFDETAKDDASIDKSNSTQAIGYLEQATKAKLNDLSNQAKLASLKNQKVAELLEQAKLETLQQSQKDSVNQSNGSLKSDYNLKGLTSDQKQELQNDLNNLAKTTQDLTGAQNEQEVLSAFNKQLATINQKFDDAAKTSQINIENARNAANKDLENQENSIYSKVNELNLTDNQKQIFSDQLKSQLDSNSGNIDKSSEFETISQYQESAKQGMQAILEQAQLQADKNIAIAKANQHRDNQKRAIDQMLGLNDTDKNDLKNQIDSSVNALVDNNSGSISTVKSKEQVDSLLAQNNADIEKIMDEAKKQNLDKINDVRTNANSELEKEVKNNTLPELTDSDLSQSYHDEINQIKSDMENSIKDNNNPSDIAYQLAQAKLKVADVKKRADLDQQRENAHQQLADYAQKLTQQLDPLSPVDSSDKDNVRDLINLISDEADFGSAQSKAEVAQLLAQKQMDMANHYQAVEQLKQSNLELERSNRFGQLADKVSDLQNQIINQRSLTPEQQEQYINQLYTELFNADDDLKQAPSVDNMDQVSKDVESKIGDIVKAAQLTNDNQTPQPTPTDTDDTDTPQPNPNETTNDLTNRVNNTVQQAQDKINQNTTLTPQQKQDYLNALNDLQKQSDSQISQPGFNPDSFDMANLNQNVQAILTSFNNFVNKQATNNGNSNPNQNTANNGSVTPSNTTNGQTATGSATNNNAYVPTNTGVSGTNGNYNSVNNRTNGLSSGFSGQGQTANTSNNSDTTVQQGSVRPTTRTNTNDGNTSGNNQPDLVQGQNSNNRSAVTNGGSNKPINKVADLNGTEESNKWLDALPFIGALIVAIGGIFWLIAKRRKDDDEQEN